MKTYKENLRETVGINQIHDILFTYSDSEKIELKEDEAQYNNKYKFSISSNNLLLLTGEFDTEPTHNLNLNPCLLSDQGGVKTDFEKEREFFKIFFKTVRNHPNLKKITKESSGLKEISKRVPRRSYELITEFQQKSGEYPNRRWQIRSRKTKFLVILTPIKKKTITNSNKDTKKNKDANINDLRKQVVLVRYYQQSDFRRGIIKGSIRAQRRKICMWEPSQANVHSPLFLDIIKKSPWFSFDRSGLIKVIFPSWIHNRIDFKILENTDEETKKEHKKETDKKDKKEENKRQEQMRADIAEAWNSMPIARKTRSLMLITQSNLRKYILLPSLIIAKNIGRMVLLQIPEWFEDLQEWNRELHIKCTYNGIQLSETEFPKNWLREGMQIKILFPFYLKPWHRSKLRPSRRNLMQNKKERNDFCFLTVWGLETDLPFGSPRQRSSFFKPIFKELERKIGKSKNTYFLVRKTLRGKTKLVSKQIKNWVIRNSFFIKIKKKIRVFSKLNPILFFNVRKVYKSNQTKNNKDSTNINEIIPESLINQIQSSNRTLTEKKNKDITARAITIRNQIERMTKDKKKNTRIYISANKRIYKDKGLEFSNFFLEIIKRRNVRLIPKIYFFINSFLEKIYINPVLSIINRSKLIRQLSLDPINKFIKKFININEADEERINKKNENKINFISIISTIQKSINTIRNQINSQKCCYLSYLSQAYVFYNLSQTQGIHLDKLRYVFKYHDYGIPFFVKNEIKIKDSFEGIIHLELNHNKCFNYGTNHWKTWVKKLKRYHQYNFSKIRWSRLLPKGLRNKISQHPMAQNCKRGSYEKDVLILFKKENPVEAYFVQNKKDNLKKNSRYDLFSYQSSNSENKNKRDLSIYGSAFETQVNRKQDSYSNSNTYKYNFFDIRGRSPIPNYIGKSDRKSMKKKPDRKHFDWKTLHFDLRQKIAIEYWIKIDTKSNQNTKIKTNNYQITDKIVKKTLFYLALPKKLKIKVPNPQKTFFDWTGMNEEIRKCPIVTLNFWLFPEFLILSNLYKMKPWVIPSKGLLLRRNLNKNVYRENKNIIENKKVEWLIPSKKKNLTNQRDLRSNVQKRVNLESRSLTNHQKNIEEDYVGSKAELKFLLKRYLLFQLRWGDALNQRMINNIKIYCLLLRLLNPTKIVISSIQRREMTLDILLIQKSLNVVELIKKGILVIEPARLSVKNDSQFILYQTLCISLVHKSKHKNNQGYPEQADIDKNFFDLLSPETILPHKYRREFRIKISFNSKNTNKNLGFCTANNCSQFVDKHKHKEKNELIKVKFLTCSNYRLEDLACMNRYWFDTNNGSRFSMLRIYMYSELKRCW
uniref:Protein TIC 214 n=1 Tax=Gentiana macrophylla TaxID=50765 RepID=A0A222AGV0_9GENT|nr:photosystem I assembly protein Ycf1 [Gentiana macrophylla]ASO75611.1 photosystem I assembly protein Ycf1 [Gentiana macrophylla]